MGQQVWTVHDGTAALEQVGRERPDIIISDIAMPHMDGYELARRLRQDPKRAGIVLVALTGYGQDGDRQRAQDAGFDHHLVKPVSLEALRGLLASLPASIPSAAPASPVR
jgi:CheY-like chemotaxis protein